MIVNLSQLKSDIAGKLRGTSIRQINDFYGTAASAANRMLGRIDTQETIRIQTLASPFFDNVNDYSLVTDFKRAIDIRPQANRIKQPGRSIYSETTPRQFLTRIDQNSFSVKWNNMTRSLRAQRLISGGVLTMDTFDAVGSWTANGDASGAYQEVLNFVEGQASLGFNLSGVTGAAYLENPAEPVTDMSSYRYEDSSFLYFYIPVGYSARFTSFNLSRGSDASNYVRASATTKADGTAFTDGWNFIRFDWNTAIKTGSPDDTKNTYRRFGISYTAGAVINGCLIDNWTDSLGELYELEYYSENFFRTAGGAWINTPTLDTDLINCGPLSYEIFLAEMMCQLTMQLRTGNLRAEELADWNKVLNGDSQSRYIRDPKWEGLYSNYGHKFPSSAIPTITSTYNFDC